MGTVGEVLRRTPLFDRHVARGARMVPFAGWELPVQYAGIRPEHEAVRNGVGLFDVSHMGRVEVTGSDALAAWQRLTSNDVSALSDGSAQYSLLCRPDGGVLDDLIAYRLAADRLLAVTNASNHQRDLAWFREQTADLEVSFADRRDELAMLAVQGPQARGLVSSLADGSLPARMHVATLSLGEVDGVVVCGTGYTGEDGVELLVPAESAPALWDALVAGGADPAGLGARDTLRLEACFPLYGNDLDEEHDPISAGLGWACLEETGFIGSEAVRAVRDAGPDEVLVPFVILGSGIARAGNPVVGGGLVTSGTLSPSLGVGIGMAYLPVARASVGTRFEIDVRGRIRMAEVRPKPLYVGQEQLVA